MQYTSKGLRLPEATDSFTVADMNFNTNSLNSLTTLPIASTTVLGGVKQGTNITIDANGVISASGGGGGATYEEGTWTPIIYNKDNSLLGTPYLYYAYYKKIGKIVTISLLISAFTSDFQYWNMGYIRNLPFATITNGIASCGSGSIMGNYGGTFDTTMDENKISIIPKELSVNQVVALSMTYYTN